MHLCTVVGSPEAETSCSEPKGSSLEGSPSPSTHPGLYKQRLENPHLALYIPCRPLRRAFCILSVPSQPEEGWYIGDGRFKVTFLNTYHCHPGDTGQRPANQGRQAVLPLTPALACTGLSPRSPPVKLVLGRIQRPALVAQSSNLGVTGLLLSSSLPSHPKINFCPFFSFKYLESVFFPYPHCDPLIRASILSCPDYTTAFWSPLQNTLLTSSRGDFTKGRSGDITPSLKPSMASHHFQDVFQNPQDSPQGFMCSCPAYISSSVLTYNCPHIMSPNLSRLVLV